jgi:hypothetical protein
MSGARYTLRVDDACSAIDKAGEPCVYVELHDQQRLQCEVLRGLLRRATRQGRLRRVPEDRCGRSVHCMLIAMYARSPVLGLLPLAG